MLAIAPPMQENVVLLIRLVVLVVVAVIFVIEFVNFVLFVQFVTVNGIVSGILLILYQAIAILRLFTLFAARNFNDATRQPSIMLISTLPPDPRPVLVEQP
jgi:hypothetical protein